VSLKLDTNLAKQADNTNASIRESGKYVGIITRAERLVSQQGTEGLGLSFKSSTGQAADYLDIYTHKSNGEALSGAKTVNAILACLKLRGAEEGGIVCEKWDANTKKRVNVRVEGYPDLMGKKIGLLLQKELTTSIKDGSDREGVTIYAVFNAETELTASEILDGKQSPERLPKMVEALMANPVRDRREKKPAGRPAAPARTGFDDMDDDIPF